MSKQRKRCRRCNRLKAKHLYHSDQWGLKRKRPLCKSCRHKHDPTYLESRDRYYRETYNITLAEYEAMLESQGGTCAICRKRPGKRRLAVDHDHKIERATNTRASVRGLLCSPCNKYLGHVRDDPIAGLRLTGYLDCWPSHSALERKNT